MVGDTRLRCDCCGTRETLGGCVRGVIPCNCPQSDYIRMDHERRDNMRCVHCLKCPQHCTCQQFEGGGLRERIKRKRDAYQRGLAMSEMPEIREPHVVDLAVLLEAVRELNNDHHAFSTRPCQTCANMSYALGYDFGCTKRAIMQEKLRQRSKQ